LAIDSAEQHNDLLNGPHMIRDACLHRRRYAERLMRAAEMDFRIAN